MRRRFMIIFGTKGITSTPEKGEFNCPTCGQKRPYGLKRVRRFFTLYFIPVIPLDKLGEYVECDTCRDTYKTNILDYDPEANAARIEAEYYIAIKKVMIYVLLADGQIEESEIETVQSIYHELTNTQISTATLLEEIKAIQTSQENLSHLLQQLQGFLNSEGKEMVVKAAMKVALADGVFQQEEKDMIKLIGQNLEMTPAHIKGIVSELVQDGVGV